MAIDANLESVEEDGVMEVFGYMKKLRQARRGLVETLVNSTTPFSSTANLRISYIIIHILL